MTCETCGAAANIVEQSKKTKNDRFEEKWECANGHVGWVKGKVSDHPSDWSRCGVVFEDRSVCSCDQEATQ